MIQPGGPKVWDTRCKCFCVCRGQEELHITVELHLSGH